MTEILVGVDGSGAGDRALDWAVRAAAAWGADLLVVQTVERGAAYDPEHVLTTTRSELEQQVRAAAGEAGVDATTIVELGDARDVLPTEATRRGVEMVVTGTRGTGGFTGLGLGGVARHLAHGLSVPYTVVPLGADSELSGSPVVVGVDGSAGSSAALRWAGTAATATGGKVVAVFAHDPLGESSPDPQLEDEQYPGEADVRAQLDLAREEGTECELELGVGNPVEVLNDEATQLGAGLIVVGRRSRGSIRGLMLGRVPAQLLHHAAVPVTLVPS